MSPRNGLFAGITGLLLTALIIAPTLDVFKSLTWLDQQRTLQIAMLMLSATGLLLIGPATPLLRVTLASRYLLLAILLLAVTGSLFATSGQWAFTELALWLGLWGLAVFSALACQREPHLVVLFHATALVVASLLCIDFASSLGRAFAHRQDLVGKELLNGFENMRWLGQFQALSIPLIGGIWLMVPRPLWQRLIFVMLVCWWVTIWVGESRGAWLALLGVLGASYFLGLGPRRYYLALAASALIGLFLYMALFHWLAPALGMGNDSRELETLATDSSLRREMWQATLAAIPEHPILGWGGMAFAGSDAFISGHPHNAFLQIAYEWGLPVLLCCLALLARAFSRVWPQLLQAKHRQTGQPLLLTTAQSLAIMIVHAMVSGVIVMPYAQNWFAVLAGATWAMTQHAPPEASPSRHRFRALLMAGTVLAASLWLVHVAIRDYPRLTHFDERPGYGRDAPRFWLRGGIKLSDETNPAP